MSPNLGKRGSARDLILISDVAKNSVYKWGIPHFSFELASNPNCEMVLDSILVIIVGPIG